MAREMNENNWVHRYLSKKKGFAKEGLFYDTG